MRDIKDATTLHPQGLSIDEMKSVGRLTSQYGDEGRPKQVPMMEMIQKRIANNNDNSAALDRAYNILSAHPEFEDLLWLMNNQHLLY